MPQSPSAPEAEASGSITAGLLNGMAAGVLWGLVFLIPRLLDDFSAWQITSARFLFYGAMALALLLPRWRRVIPLVGRREWLALLGLSLLGNLIYYVFLVLGVQWGGSAPAALIVGLVPVVLTFIGTFERGAIGLRALWAPMALSLFGVLAVAIYSLSQTASPDVSVTLWQRLVGIVCAFAALGCWAGWAVWNRSCLLLRPDISPWNWSLLTGVMTGVLALLLAVPAFLGPVLSGDTSHDTGDWLRLWLTTGTLAILASVLGNSFWNRANRLLPSTMIGQLVVFETIFALIYGFLYDWRLPGVLEWLAMGSLICGVLWCAQIHQRKHG